MNESRIKKSWLNAKVNLIVYFTTLPLTFFSRKIFLDSLGADFIGLTGTLQNLLGFLNLAELGIGSAIGYVLYKPLFDQDKCKINEIISVFGYLYRNIGLIILGAGIILGGCLPFIFPRGEFDMGVIYFAYISFLTSTLIGYFINYRQTLLGADQKNYIVTAYFQTANLLKIGIQMVCAWKTGNYYLWIGIELFFGIIYSIILNYKINKVYPWLKSEIREGKLLFKKYPEVMKYTKQIFVHKVGDAIQFQTTPSLIYLFVSLSEVAFYGNYEMIRSKIVTLINGILSSTEAGIGNLIAENNINKNLQIFWELFATRFFIVGFFCFNFYMLMEGFIALWLGDKYILPHIILILILCDFFIHIIGGIFNQFLNGYGLFYDIWSPIAGAVLFIIIAVSCGYLMGLKGILLGSILSSLVIVSIWKPYFLFKKGFKISVLLYWKEWIKYCGLMAISFVVVNYVMKMIVPFLPSNGWFNWLCYAGMINILFCPIYFIFLYVWGRGMSGLVKRILHKKLERDKFIQ
ncbi:MAG: sugar transporter [Akkermansia sp.]